MFFRDDELDKTKKVADEVIESVGEVIKNSNLPSEGYAKTLSAFAELIAARAELI